MIIGTPIGDITTLNPEEPSDIIVGMNTKLEELDSLLLPQKWHAERKVPFKLGDVLSFKLDRRRQLHMLLCHHVEKNGWADADKYVRIGMDYLWLRHKDRRDFSIVKIGAGRVGTAGGADVNKIRAAMAASHLPVTLVMNEASRPVDVRTIKSRQLSEPEVWSPLTGIEQ